jgi:uncharacterized protein
MDNDISFHDPTHPEAAVIENAAIPQPIAPAWHTLLITALIIGNSLVGSSRVVNKTGNQSRFLIYGGTLIVELVLLLLVWLGIRRRMSMRELIGGKWKSVEDFLLDIAVAAIFFVVATGVNVGTRMALGVLQLHNFSQQASEIKRTLGPLIPQSAAELTFFIVLAVAAGLIEEILFRGYLQRQIGLLARHVWVGIVASAAVFGLAHGYQGWRNMIVIGVYGALFGILAQLRKSLRPGMMAHAFQDAYSGIALFFFTRHGLM